MTGSPVHICGRRVEDARHVCALVTSRDEEYAIRGPFVREGIANGERVLEIVDADLRADHDARMERAGVDPRAAGEAVATLSWEDAYLKDGHFDQDRMLAMVEGALDAAKTDGYPRLRGMANMSWAVKGAPGTEQLLEYETRVNAITEGRPDVLVCCYEADKLPAGTVVDLLRTHPAVIIGGVYHENPYFIPPKQMLAELVARGKAKRI